MGELITVTVAAKPMLCRPPDRAGLRRMLSQLDGLTILLPTIVRVTLDGLGTGSRHADVPVGPAQLLTGVHVFFAVLDSMMPPSDRILAHASYADSTPPEWIACVPIGTLITRQVRSDADLLGHYLTRKREPKPEPPGD